MAEEDLKWEYLSVKLTDYLFRRYPRIFNKERMIERDLHARPLPRAHRMATRYNVDDTNFCSDEMVTWIGDELAFETLRDLTLMRINSFKTEPLKPYMIFPCRHLVTTEVVVDPNTFVPVLGFKIHYGVMTLEDYYNGR